MNVVIVPQHLIVAGVMTGTQVVRGTGFKIKKGKFVSLICSWTGTPTGSFSFEVNNHPQPILPDGSANPAAQANTVLTLPAAFAAGNPSGAAGNFDFQFINMPEQWIFPVYTNSAGSGTGLECWGSAK